MAEEREDILQIYRIAVRNAIVSGNSEVVPNSSPQHAAIIIEEMLDAAKESFCAFSGAFHDDVWNESVINSLRRALRRGVKLSLVASDSADCIPEELKANSFIVCQEKIAKADPPIQKLRNHHFAISDGRVVRVEYDLVKRLAAFSANRPDVANVLIDEFIRLKNVSTKVAA